MTAHPGSPPATELAVADGLMPGIAETRPLPDAAFAGHGAVAAARAGRGDLAQGDGDILIIAPGNFAGGIDPALASRADWIFEIPLPGLKARRAILEKTITSVAVTFRGAGRLLDPA